MEEKLPLSLTVFRSIESDTEKSGLQDEEDDGLTIFVSGVGGAGPAGHAGRQEDLARLLRRRPRRRAGERFNRHLLRQNELCCRFCELFFVPLACLGSKAQGSRALEL